MMKSHTHLILLSLLTFSLSTPVQAYSLSGFKWDSSTPGVGASITWGYAADNSNCRLGGECTNGSVTDISTDSIGGGLTVADKVQEAFSAWSSVANLLFTYTTSANPDILIGGHSIDGSGNTAGHAWTNWSVLSGLNIAGISDVHLDTDDSYGLSLFNIIAHEIGHSLGLSHTGISNSLMNPTVLTSYSGPQADDINGIQYLYGQPVAAVPLPGAFWLLLSAFSIFTAMPARRKKLSSALSINV